MLPSSCFGTSGFELSASWFSDFPFWSTSVVWYRWLMEAASSAASVEKYSISTKSSHDATLDLNTQKHKVYWIWWLRQNLIYAIIDRVCLRILNNALWDMLLFHEIHNLTVIDYSLFSSWKFVNKWSVWSCSHCTSEWITPIEWGISECLGLWQILTIIKTWSAYTCYCNRMLELRCWCPICLLQTCFKMTDHLDIELFSWAGVKLFKCF